LGIFVYWSLLDRVKKHETAVMIISLSVGILFQEIILIIFGGDYHHVPPFIEGFIEILGVSVLYQQIFAILISGIILGAIWFFLAKTRLGVAIRAVAQDIEIANLMGIDVSRICMVTMGISAGLAGVAGAVVAPIYAVTHDIWMHPLIMVLAAVVLGGLGSAKGSVIAAFTLGYAETLVTFLIPGGSFLKGAISLSVMVLVLLIRPEGFFGVVFEEERL
jgi:branched-chain amino acid transport system permease protein